MLANSIAATSAARGLADALELEPDEDIIFYLGSVGLVFFLSQTSERGVSAKCSGQYEMQRTRKPTPNKYKER
jgi:hypothetical protein